MNGKITEKLQKITDDLLNNPLWADIPPFMKDADIKNLLPKIRKHNSERQRMLPLMVSFANALHQKSEIDPREICEYFNYYGLDSDLMTGSLSSIDSSNYELASYRFSPINSNNHKTILLIHGYFEHTCINATLINRLLIEGYTILAFDLPGHGFSTGARFDIDNFSSYGKALTDFLNSLSKKDYPKAIVGHSTGCAAILDYFGCGGQFDGKVILAAPLVKSYMYNYSVSGYKLVGKLTKQLPYVFHKHSNDPEFLIFKRFGDIHRPTKVPLSWFQSLIDWNDKNTEFPVIEKENLFILQGTYDRTVDWKNNLLFIKKMFPNSHEIILEGAEHNIFNDSTELRHNALERTVSLIEDI